MVSRVLGVRLTLLGDLLLVAVSLADRDLDNQLHHVLRVVDGSQASAEKWRANSGRVEGLFVGPRTSEASPRGGGTGKPGNDARTLVAIDSGPTIQVLDGTTGAVRVTANPTEYPGTVTAFNGLAFVQLDQSRSVVAYDLETLTEKWRRIAPGSGRTRLTQCGTEALCVGSDSRTVVLRNPFA